MNDLRKILIFLLCIVAPSACKAKEQRSVKSGTSHWQKGNKFLVINLNPGLKRVEKDLSNDMRFDRTFRDEENDFELRVKYIPEEEAVEWQEAIFALSGPNTKNEEIALVNMFREYLHEFSSAEADIQLAPANHAQDAFNADAMFTARFSGDHSLSPKYKEALVSLVHKHGYGNFILYAFINDFEQARIPWRKHFQTVRFKSKLNRRPAPCNKNR